MLSITLLGLLMTAAQANPLERVLFAEEKWYRDAAGAEREFEGRLDILAGDGKIGLPARFHAFRLISLENGKPVSRPIAMNGKDQLLAPYLGRPVKVFGKEVESAEGEQKVAEIWPARLLITGDAGDMVGELKVVARTNNWIPAGAIRKTQAQPHVIRDAATLARLRGYGGANTEQIATTELLRLLQPEGGGAKPTTIDWKKHMLLVMCGGNRPGGARVEIKRLLVQETGLEVEWQLSTASSGSGSITFPTEAVLVPRYDGEIRFLQEGQKTPLTIPAEGTEKADAPAGGPAQPMPAPAK